MVDQVCLDKIDEAEGRKVFTRSRETLDFAEKPGMGKRGYDLAQVQLWRQVLKNLVWSYFSLF